MSYGEVLSSPIVDGLLMSKSKDFGLDTRYIAELPLKFRERLGLLDELGVVLVNGSKRVSMLDESIMGALIVHQSELLEIIFENPDKEQLELLQRDVVRGSLLSDLGKVASPEMRWLYGGLNFDQNEVDVLLKRFLMRGYNQESYRTLQGLHLRQLPYSIAMDFHREFYSTGDETVNKEWDRQRLACDVKLKELGFRINTEADNEVVDQEASFQDIMTGAHLASLEEVVEECGIGTEADWRRAIFIAKNHHMSRGLIKGLPLPKGKSYLNEVLKGQSENPGMLLSLALVEEAVDMTFASIFRAKRTGDERGIDARRRILDNLQQSEELGRMSKTERAWLLLLVRRPGYGKKMATIVTEYVDTLRKQRKI